VLPGLQGLSSQARRLGTPYLPAATAGHKRGSFLPAASRSHRGDAAHCVHSGGGRGLPGVQPHLPPSAWLDHLLSVARPDRESAPQPSQDRKSTRLNSSHVSISYAVFCLKKKKK